MIQLERKDLFSLIMDSIVEVQQGGQSKFPNCSVMGKFIENKIDDTIKINNESVTKGIWEINKGKNDRIYIKCSDKSKIMHPQDLCEINGLGIYDYDRQHISDLAEALLLFNTKK